MKGLIDNLVAIDNIDSDIFNNALWVLQKRLGVTSGDVAGRFLDDYSAAWVIAPRLARAEIIFQYIHRELADLHDSYVAQEHI